MYVDNFLSLVGFNLELGDRQLLLGLNGVGKSTVFRAIGAVRDIVEGRRSCAQVFSRDTLTRWQLLKTQQIELHVELPETGLLRYVLAVEHSDQPDRPVRLVKETLHDDRGPLFEYTDGEIRLFRDDHSPRGRIPLEVNQSVLGTIAAVPENTRLSAFRDWVRELYVLRVDSPHMATEARGTELQPLADDAKNFANWYREVVLSDQALAAELRQKIAEVLPGFVSLDLKPSGAEASTLSAKFEVGDRQPPNLGRPIAYGFGELSDGQRSLIALYTLLYFALRDGRTLCIDQPDEYLAIDEIQPWLLSALNEVDGGRGQLLLISHHPELINLLAPERGLWFERPTGAGTRVRPFAALPGSPLPPAEQIARGENNVHG